MSELPAITESIHHYGYGSVPIDVHKSDLQEAMDYYLEFLRLDQDIHDKTRFDISKRGDSDFGQYTRHAGETNSRGLVADNKDIFHFGSLSQHVMAERFPSGIPQDLGNFLEAAAEIYWAGQRAKKLAVEQLDSPNLETAFSADPNRLNDVLRFIAYYANAEQLAKGHFDRGIATLAIGESHEGLRIAPGQNGLKEDITLEYMNSMEERLQPADYTDGEAKFFLGAGWNRLPAELTADAGELPLGWHDVVPSEKKVSQFVMRWAVVMFLNPPLGLQDYIVPSPAETRPYKQLGRVLMRS